MVYLLIHDDMGDIEVRGVYVSREAAEADLVSRTKSGAPSRAWDAHNIACCRVEDWEVQASR